MLDPPEDGDDTTTTDPKMGLSVVIGAVTALVVGIGALTLTGTLGRVQRNHDVAFALAIGLVVLGTALIAMSTALERTSWTVAGHTLKKRQAVQVTGMLLGLTGVVIGFGAAVFSASETERPTLDVKLDQATLTVTGTVSASDLSSSDGLEVRVDGLIDFDHDLDTVDPVKVVNLSRTVVGPDSDGKASQELDVQLPHGGYDAVGVTASVGNQEEPCGLSRRESVDGGTACIDLPLPRRIARPALVALWGRRAGSEHVVVLKLSGRDLNAGSLPRRPLLLRAVGVRHGHMLRLYRTVIDPAPRGATKQTVRVRVPDGVSIVCAGTTRAAHSAIACPIRGTSAGAVELHTTPRASRQ